MATPDFFGPRLKLARAKQQKDCLLAELRKFGARHPSLLTVEPSDNLADTYIVYADVPLPIPPQFGVMVGEVLHNQRSALDQVVYQLAQRNHDHPRGTGFPMFVTEHDFVTHGLPRIKLLDDAEQSLIAALQPFHAKAYTDPKFELLAVLNHLNNIDKHQTIPLVRSARASKTQIHMSTPDQTPLASRVAHFTTQQINYGVADTAHSPIMEIRLYPPPGGSGPIDIRVDAELTALFGNESERAQGLSVPDVLQEIQDLTCGIVDLLDPDWA